jgi:hypothetical protein
MLSNYNINGINSFYPSGSVLAYIGGTTDPPGWVIADGVERTNTNNIYNPLSGIGIGNVVGSTYTPPNLRAAFLRGTGTNSVYSGPSLQNTQTHALQNHTHSIYQNAQHSHNVSPTLSTTAGSTTVATYGLAEQIGPNMDGTSNAEGGTFDNRVNIGSTAALKILNATPTTTIDNTGTDTETAPYCYGVLWIIKL